MIVPNVPSLPFMFRLTRENWTEFSSDYDIAYERLMRDVMNLENVVNCDGNPTVAEFLEYIGYEGEEDIEGNNIVFYEYYIIDNDEVFIGLTKERGHYLLYLR